jgi:hypothetical protein
MRIAIVIWLAMLLACLTFIAARADDYDVLTRIERELGPAEWRFVVTVEDTARRQIAVGRDMLKTADGYEVELAKEMIERGENLLEAVYSGDPHTEELMMLTDEMEMSAEGMAWNY